MEANLEILNLLAGKINFVFDKATLLYAAYKSGISEAESLVDVDEEQEDAFHVVLLESIVYGPYQTASSTNKHGQWEKTVGSQTITASALESIKAELKRLYKKQGDESKIEMLEGTGGETKWIDEGIFC